MKRNGSFILTLFLVVVTNYSLMAYAGDQKKVESSVNFHRTYRHKPIDTLVKLLGKENRIEKAGNLLIYVWDFDNLDNMPIKIKDSKSNYINYVDRIDVIVLTSSNTISSMKFASNKGWRSEDMQAGVSEKEKVQAEKEEKGQAAVDNLDKPLSALTVLSLINENTRTSTQISEFRKSAYGKYVEGVGIVTDVISKPPLPTKGKKYIPGDSINVNTILISLVDKKDAKKGLYHVKMGTDMETSSISLFQKIKFKGVFGRSKVGTTGEYVQLNNGEFELLK